MLSWSVIVLSQSRRPTTDPCSALARYMCSLYSVIEAFPAGFLLGFYIGKGETVDSINRFSSWVGTSLVLHLVVFLSDSVNYCDGLSAARSCFAMRRTDDRKMPSFLSISYGLLWVCGALSWLQMSSSTSSTLSKFLRANWSRTANAFRTLCRATEINFLQQLVHSCPGPILPRKLP